MPFLDRRRISSRPDFEAAREALIAAADAHCAVHAYRDAARALRTVLEHWPADTETTQGWRVVGSLASARRCAPEYAEAVTLLRELADGHERRGEVGCPGRRARLALVHELRGQWEAALTAREAAAVAFSAAGLRAEAAIDRLAAACPPARRGLFSASLGTLVRPATRRIRADRPAAAGEGLRGNLLAPPGSPGRASRRSGRRWTRRWRPR